MYALTFELERRLNSEVTWEEAQTWDVKIDQRRARDRIADAEAEAAIPDERADRASAARGG